MMRKWRIMMILTWKMIQTTLGCKLHIEKSEKYSSFRVFLPVHTTRNLGDHDIGCDCLGRCGRV